MKLSAIKAAGITIGVIYAAAYAAKTVANKHLRHFKPAEFGIWWPLINSDLLDKLDQFRDYLRTPVIVSPAPGAIGRIGADHDSSQHFPRPQLNAIDVMVPGATMNEMYQAAKIIGFHGIGLYPHWKPHPGIHLDIREDRTSRNPATWSAIPDGDGQKYVALSVALA